MFTHTQDTPVDQGIVTIRATFADTTSKNFVAHGSAYSAMYPGAEQPGVFSIKAHGKFAFVWNPFPRNSVGLGPAALTAMNGAGSLEAKMFPKDEDMQIASLKSKMTPMGFIVPGTVYEEKSGHMGSGFVIGIAGKYRNGPTLFDMPIGSLVKLRPIKPSEMKKLRPVDGDRLSTVRAEIIAEPATPKGTFDTACETVAHTFNYYNNNAAYSRCLIAGDRCADQWSAFAVNLGKFILTSGLQFVHYLAQNNFIAPPLVYISPSTQTINTDPESSYWPNSIKQVSRCDEGKVDLVAAVIEATITTTSLMLGVNVTDEERDAITAEVKRKHLPAFIKEVLPDKWADNFAKNLACAFGIVDGDFCKDAKTISPDVREECSVYRKVDIINKVIVTGKTENYEFGFKPDGRNPGKHNGEVVDNTLEGLILSDQYNSWRKLVASLSDAVELDLTWSGGKVVSPCERGGFFEGFL